MGRQQPTDTWQSMVTQVATDRQSGASAIAVKCAAALIAFCEQEAPATVEALRVSVLQIARKILDGQPSMAPLLRILNDAALAVSGSTTPAEALLALRRTCEEYIDRIESASANMCEHALSVIPLRATILTLSYSTAVANCLLFAAEKQRELAVICLESRPNLEGRALAALLGEHGISTTLLVDAAAYDVLHTVDLWLAGADCLAAEGVINKLGTALVACAAYALGVPGYVVCDTTKIWPAMLPYPLPAEHDAGEVWREAPSAVCVRNRYFDLTPWPLVTGVIAESGLLTAAEVLTLCHSLSVSADIIECVHRKADASCSD